MKVNKFELKFDPEQIVLFKDMADDILTNDLPISNGKYVTEFEGGFKVLQKVPYAVAVGSGTDALEMALLACDVEGSSVVIPDNTMIGTAFAVIKAGAKVHPLDIELDTFAIDPDELRDTLSQEKNIGAVILVHIGGMISDYIDEIVEICKDHEVPLIEDSAQAHLARKGKLHAGTIGRFGCFSFSATKDMTTAEGGIVTCTNMEDYNKLRSLRSFGTEGNEFLHRFISGNYKMTEFQGALGITELMRAKKRYDRRKVIAERYINEVINEAFEPVLCESIPSYYKQILKCDTKADDVEAFCKKEDVSMTGRVYPVPVHQQECFKHYPIVRTSFRRSSIHATHHICPPNYPELTDEQVNFVIEVLNKYVE